MYPLPFIITLLAVSLGHPVPVSVQLSEEDLGRTVEIGVGDILEVVLKGNPTTGYIWDVVSPDKGILKQVGKTKFKPDTKARGSGGKLIMRFEAAKEGKTSLKLIYHRPFEKDRPPIRTFEVRVTVK
ncbi:MAG: protease inhibitor I42 family protein [Desulfobacteraceae bacterium]|nr:protease inhibitor I42 family protein [Desulfobacteraceae bacterium]